MKEVFLARRDHIRPTVTDTASGLAATSEGKYFVVPFANDGLTLYQHKVDDEGVAYADEVLKFPTQAKVDDALAELDAIFANVGKAGAVTYVASIAGMRGLDTTTLLDGQQVSVRGYYAGTRLGGGVMYWDAGSTEADNGVTVFAVDGVATGRWHRQKTQPLTPLDAGAAGDGISNDTAHIQQMLAALSDRSTVDFLGLNYLIDAGQISVTGKNHITLNGNGARLVESGQNTLDTLSFDNCDYLKIRDFDIEGMEDFAYWQSTDMSGAGRVYFFRVDNSVSPKISGITGRNKRCAIILSQCVRGSVYEVDYTGFMPDLDLETHDLARYTSVVFIEGGRQNRAWSFHAENHGSAVLIGLDSIAPTIHSVSGYNIHDNVVYVSSATRARVFGVDGEKIKGSAVKTRGSLNLTFGCTAEYTQGNAFIATGNGDPDSYGANGHGNIVALNTVMRGGTQNGGGVSIGEQDGYASRDSIAALNAIENSGSPGAYAAIYSAQVHGGMTALNSIGSTDADFAILVPTTTGMSAQNIRQSTGVVLGNVNHGSRPVTSIRLTDVDKFTVVANSGDLSGTLVDARIVDNSVFLGNLNPHGLRSINFTSGYSYSGNLLVGNRGSTMGTAGTGQENGYVGNYPQSGHETTSDAGAYQGMITVTAGQAYIWLGSAWVQITNPA